MKALLILVSLTIGMKAFANPVVYSTKNVGIGLGLTTLSPTYSTAATALNGAFKEEVAQVEQDALNALAGEPISLALAELIAKLRAEHPEAEELTDLEIIELIVHPLDV